MIIGDFMEENVQIYGCDDHFWYEDGEKDEFSEVRDIFGKDINHIINYLSYYSKVQNKALLEELIEQLKNLKTNLENCTKIAIGNYHVRSNYIIRKSIPEFELEDYSLIRYIYHYNLIKQNMRDFYFCKSECINVANRDRVALEYETFCWLNSKWMVFHYEIKNQTLVKEKYYLSDLEIEDLKRKIYSR